MIINIIILFLCVLLIILILRSKKTERRQLFAAYRVAYRHGIVAGYKRCEGKWVRRRQRALHDAGRRTDVREDAGPSARVTRIKYQSGP